MTNEEKFIRIFGVEPDTESMVLKCPYENATEKCSYYEELDGGCHCETWWHKEYKKSNLDNFCDHATVVISQLRKDRDLLENELSTIKNVMEAFDNERSNSLPV